MLPTNNEILAGINKYLVSAPLYGDGTGKNTVTVKNTLTTITFQKAIVEVKSFAAFYPAESYHQEYILHHPENRYVQLVSIPDYLHFRKTFREGKFKA